MSEKGKPRGRPFPKGVSGNPKGRPPTPPEVREYAQLHTFEAIDGLLSIAQESDNDSARVSAWNAILDRAVGKPPQALEVSGDQDKPLQHEHHTAPPSPDELADVLRLLVGAGALPDSGATDAAHPSAGTEAVEILGTPADDDSTSSTPRPE